MSSTLIDIKGQRFGRLTVIERAPDIEGVKNALWKCRCDCGNETVAMGSSLRTGRKKSCGCLMKKAYAVEKNCEYCGNPVMRADHRFCSKSCAALSRCNVPIERAKTGAFKPVENDDPNGKTAAGRYRCPHQRFVSCDVRDCAHCGWNPEVARRRSAEINKKLKGASV